MYWFTIAASCSDEECKKSLISSFECSVARYYLGIIYTKIPPFSNSDGSLDLAKYWFQKAIDCNVSDCNFSDEVRKQEEPLLDEGKNVKGNSQCALALHSQ